MDQSSGNCVVNYGVIQGDVNQTQGEVRTKDTSGFGANKCSGEKDRYDVALSYAGEQEHFVSRVAKLLETEGLKVFFAPRCEEDFIAKDMIVRFYKIYRYESRYVAAFVTDEYLKKDVTMHEASTAMLRMREEGRNCLIPIYFGQARLEHLDPDINYIHADGLREAEIAEKIRSIVQ